MSPHWPESSSAPCPGRAPAWVCCGPHPALASAAVPTADTNHRTKHEWTLEICFSCCLYGSSRRCRRTPGAIPACWWVLLTRCREELSLLWAAKVSSLGWLLLSTHVPPHQMTYRQHLMTVLAGPQDTGAAISVNQGQSAQLAPRIPPQVSEGSASSSGCQPPLSHGCARHSLFP